MKDQIANVRKFHEVYGVPIVEAPLIPSPERCKLRQDLIEEEVREFKEAWEQGDTVGCLDALVDQLYIIFGTAHEFGLADLLVPAFAEVSRSNMSKLDENGYPIYREDGKILKSKLYSPPNLEPLILEAVIQFKKL